MPLPPSGMPAGIFLHMQAIPMTATHMLPPGAGASFKPAHFRTIAEQAQPVAFFEVHAENYMGAGGPPHAMLSKLRADYALSIHGVGLSLGGEEPLNTNHLERLRVLCERYEPQSFSEHLAWSSHGGEFLNDLLPLPYTGKTLARLCDHIDQTQAHLKRRLLLENPSTYVVFEESTWDEAEFLAEIARRTGCGLLLDINNVYVSAINHRFDPRAYLNRFALAAVGEIHLAGHTALTDQNGNPYLIDTHGGPVIEQVWALYAETIARAGAVPTLIEWDNDLPEWPALLSEVRNADAILSTHVRKAA